MNPISNLLAAPWLLGGVFFIGGLISPWKDVTQCLMMLSLVGPVLGLGTMFYCFQVLEDNNS